MRGLRETGSHRGSARVPLARRGLQVVARPAEQLYQYFAPSAGDAWSIKIRGWQERERVSAPDPNAASTLDASSLGDLRAKYDAFREERRRELARSVAKWIQEQARDHYIADGPVDHWATFAETFQRNGDDCDGLELLVFHFLRDLGFPENEVFRAIVVRRTDGQHHMVTLWFEDPADPWVIDPTGAMTTGMPRMSEMPEWVPLKIFSDVADWSVRDGRFAAVPR
jgi:predicted transglutaminase-like cysteine proteinase